MLVLAESGQCARKEGSLSVDFNSRLCSMFPTKCRYKKSLP